MDFKDALNVIIKNNRCEVLDDIFRVRSILCDYVGFSPYQTKLVYLFCDIYKEYNLIKIFKDKGLIEGRKYLISIYPKYESYCSFKDFKEAINPISEIICPKEYKKDIEHRIGEKQDVICAVKKQNNNVKKKQEVIKGLSIQVNAKSLTIEPGDEFAVYNDTYKKIDLKGFAIVSGVLQLKLKYAKNNITIKVPKYQTFENVNIKTTSANIDIKDHIIVNKCNIETKDGNVNVVVNGNELKFKTTVGNVKFTGNLTSIEGSTNSGNISYFLIPTNKSKISVKLISIYGDINGFLAFRLRRKLTSLLFKTRKVSADVFANGCLVSLYHKTDFGRVKIK